jgi:hypothetical protein
VCTPYALHASNTVDFAPGHSLMETLRGAGLRHLFATDWRSADPTMRIDAYLADLIIAMDSHLAVTLVSSRMLIGVDSTSVLNQPIPESPNFHCDLLQMNELQYSKPQSRSISNSSQE